MTEKDWRAYVEAHKFTGPTIKLLQVEPNLFAILDHEYNLIAVATSNDLWTYCNSAFVHPPQRERPKPKLYEYNYDTQSAKPVPDVSRMSIDTGDLDL